MDFELVIPSVEHELQAIKFANSFPGSIDGDGGLKGFCLEYNNYIEYVDIVEKHVIDGDKLTYFAMTEDEIIGIITLKIKPNALDKRFCGQVALSVKPEYRGHGIGKEMLYRGFKVFKEYGINEVLITADVNNKSSNINLNKFPKIQTNIVHNPWQNCDMNCYIYDVNEIVKENRL